MRKKDNNSVSLAGEFAVLSQLALNNYDANMTLGRTKSVDILVSDPETLKMYKLEVKTKYRTSPKESVTSKDFGTVIGEWMMSTKHETLIDPSLYYCFVIICEPTEQFHFYIVPSSVVAKYVKEEHEHWKRQKEGKKDNDIRMFRLGFKGEQYSIETPLVETYKNKWEFV